jgi:hypothetical protein
MTTRMCCALVAAGALAVAAMPVQSIAQKSENTIHVVTRAGTVRVETGQFAQRLPPLSAADRIISRRTGDRIRKSATPVSVGGSTIWAEPYRIPELYRVRSKGGTGSVDFTMMFNPDGFLAYDPASKQFRGSVAVVLWDSTTSAGTQLDSPFNILVTSPEGKASPMDLRIDHTNFPPTLVTLNLNPAADPAKVVFSTATNARGDTSDIPVQPVLMIGTDGKEVQGFGVESIPLTVIMEPGIVKVPPTVSFETSRGTIEPETTTIDRGMALATLRSSGVGTAMVAPSAPGYRTLVREFTFVWPVRFILASLVGAVIGAFAKKGKKTFRVLSGGVLAGFIVAAAWWGIGLNLLPVDLPRVFNELAVLAVTALGSFLGSSALLKRLQPAG